MIRITLRNKPLCESSNTLTVYHGGRWDGRTPIKVNGRGALGIGAYFSPDPQVATEYARDSGLNYIVRCELNLTNPLTIDEAGHSHPAVQALIQLGIDEKMATRLISNAEERKGYPGTEISSRALAAGHDGLIRKYNGQIREIVIWQPQLAIRPEKIGLEEDVLSEAAKFDLPDAQLVFTREGNSGFEFNLYIRDKILGTNDYMGYIFFAPNPQFKNIWNVMNVSVDRDGYGPALYEAAMETAQKLGAIGLAPDRNTVSPFAEAVWEKYNARADIHKSPLPDGYRRSKNHSPVLQQVFSKSYPNYLDGLIRSGKIIDKEGILS